MKKQLSPHRIMWLFVFFDLPVKTAKERRRYREFRKKLLDLGFYQYQYSVYIRHCPTREIVASFIEKVRKAVPESGHVSILRITDKQYSKIINIWGIKKKNKKPPDNTLPLIFYD